MVGLLLVANTLNVAADLAAMAEALRLLAGGSSHVYAATFGLWCLVLQVFLPYTRYVRWLKWLTLALLADVAVDFSLHLDWWQEAVGLVHPNLPAGVQTRDVLLMVVAIFGTTIRPCLFFWQAAGVLDIQTSAQAAEALRPLAGELRAGGWLATAAMAATDIAMCLSL